MYPVHHTREEQWKGLPVGSVEELLDPLKELRDLVSVASGQEILSAAAGITYPDKQYRGVTLSELRELAPTLSLDQANLLLWALPAGRDKEVMVKLHVLNGDGVGPSAGLEVSGRSEIAVNGVFVAARDRIEKLYERTRHAEEPAAVKGGEAEATWRKVVDNPWTIQIGAGIVLLGVGLLFGMR